VISVATSTTPTEITRREVLLKCLFKRSLASPSCLSATSTLAGSGSSGLSSPAPPNSERIWRAALSISRSFFSPSRGRNAGAGLFGQGFSVELDLLAFFQKLFVLVLFALDLHALERVEHGFVLLFDGRITRAGALRPGRRNDQE